MRSNFMRSNCSALAILAIACGLVLGGARPAAAQAPAPPCTFLTPAQVGAAIGSTVGAGQPIGNTGCSWTTPTGVPHAVVTLSFWPAQRFGEMPPTSNITRANVSGVGDQAFYATIGTLTSLSVRKKTTAFVLHVYGVPGTQQQMATERSLALAVAARL